VEYQVTIHAKALRDLRHFSPDVARRILLKVRDLQGDLAGDVKQLKNHDPGWRLRVGDYRVLFDLHGAVILVRRIAHRRDVYD